MVLLIIIPIKWLFVGNIPYFQTNPVGYPEFSSENQQLQSFNNATKVLHFFGGGVGENG